MERLNVWPRVVPANQLQDCSQDYTHFTSRWPLPDFSGCFNLFPHQAWGFPSSSPSRNFHPCPVALLHNHQEQNLRSSCSPSHFNPKVPPYTQIGTSVAPPILNATSETQNQGTVNLASSMTLSKGFLLLGLSDSTCKIKESTN